MDKGSGVMMKVFFYSNSKGSGLWIMNRSQLRGGRKSEGQALCLKVCYSKGQNENLRHGWQMHRNQEWDRDGKLGLILGVSGYVYTWTKREPWLSDKVLEEKQSWQVPGFCVKWDTVPTRWGQTCMKPNTAAVMKRETGQKEAMGNTGGLWHVCFLHESWKLELLDHKTLLKSPGSQVDIKIKLECDLK